MKPLRALILAVPLLLGACGLRPLYSGGESGSAASALTAVEVGPIAGQKGWLVRNALDDRLHHSKSAVRYRLEVELDDQITGYGISGNAAVTRERRQLRARYRLVDATTGGVLLDQTASADAGIDVVSSEYATIAAEQTALERLSTMLADQIVARLATYLRRQGDRASATSGS